MTICDECLQGDYYVYLAHSEYWIPVDELNEIYKTNDDAVVNNRPTGRENTAV
jgi:hypothetical protein